MLSLGVNVTPLTPTHLRFAEVDAVRLAQPFTSSRGPIDEDDVTVLLGGRATLAAVRMELDMLTLFPPEHLLFAWSGHGGDDGIALADGMLGYDELAQRLGQINSRVKIAVLATCHAGAAQRPFTTRIAGLGDLQRAWHEVLLAACPGLRLFMAVGPNGISHDDPTVRGSRFIWAFLRVLRYAHGDIAWRGHRWISDVSLTPKIRRLIEDRWPHEALPQFTGPSGVRAPFPLLLSQAHMPIGFANASVTSRSPLSADISVCAFERKHVSTEAQATAFAADGTVIASGRAACVPRGTADRFNWTLNLTEEDFLRNPFTRMEVLSGNPATVVWHVCVLDDHKHVLAQDQHVTGCRMPWAA